MGATLKANDDDIQIYAVDNCHFALIEVPTKYGYSNIKSRTPGLYWGRMKNYCILWSRFGKVHWN